MSYYTAITLIELCAALVMIVVIHMNPVINIRMRIAFEFEFLVLCLIVVSEWVTVYLNGAPENLRLLHYAMKIFQFSLTPLFLAIMMISFESRWSYKLIFGIAIVHAIMEIGFAPFGLIFYMDENNVYTRGNFYFIYVVIYCIEIVLLSRDLAQKSRAFQDFNIAVILMGVGFLLVGVGIQLVFRDVKTAWLSTELTLIMVYIYVGAILLQTDKTTGMLNRFCYDKKLEEINYPTVIMIFDVDNFKSINDNFGHLVGDMCLKLAADLIRKNFGKEGTVYRIGGDEFAVIFRRKSKYAIAKSDEMMWALIDRFALEVKEIRKDEPRFTSISVGYSFNDEDFSINWAVEHADRQMYQEKAKRKEIERMP